MRIRDIRKTGFQLAERNENDARGIARNLLVESRDRQIHASA